MKSNKCILYTNFYIIYCSFSVVIKNALVNAARLGVMPTQNLLYFVDLVWYLGVYEIAIYRC